MKASDACRGEHHARLAIGRAGLRYRTATALKLRADHCIARDAVQAELPDDFADRHGLLALCSRCRDHGEYLLRPDLGRRLSPESQAVLEREGTRGCDVQIVIGDGLSAPAVALNAAPLLEHLGRELRAAGFTLARPVFVRFARVGVQDVIGLSVAARATLIVVGERPGLGTGDSASIYLAYGPRLDQDNAEKNCISNVRPWGLQPDEAAREAASILRRCFERGTGGVGAER